VFTQRQTLSSSLLMIFKIILYHSRKNTRFIVQTMTRVSKYWSTSVLLHTDTFSWNDQDPRHLLQAYSFIPRFGDTLRELEFKNGFNVPQGIRDCVQNMTSLTKFDLRSYRTPLFNLNNLTNLTSLSLNYLDRNTLLYTRLPKLSKLSIQNTSLAFHYDTLSEKFSSLTKLKLLDVGLLGRKIILSVMNGVPISLN
jgi:hypothetical protein